MTIKSVVLVPSTNEIKVSKEKVVTLVLSKKNEKSYKFDGAYHDDLALSEIFATHMHKSVTDVMSGLNCSIVNFDNTISDGSLLQLDKPSFFNLLLKSIFAPKNQVSSKTESFVAVSMLQVNSNGKCTDLISPHGRKISVKHHAASGVYVDGLSQLICSSAEEAIRLYEDGYQLVNAMKLAPYLTCFTVQVCQRTLDGASSTNSSAKFVTFNADHKNMTSVSDILSAITQKKGKMTKSESDSSVVKELLVDSLIGNCNTTLVAKLSSHDIEDAGKLLSTVESLTGLGVNPKVSRNDTEAVLYQLRHDISKIRDRLASQSNLNKDDLSLMEKLMSDLEATKRMGWDQTILRSEQFYEERKTSFANKGLSWILESTKSANRDSIKNLQNLKNKLTLEYKNQREITDRLNNDLRQKIDSYTQLVNSGKSEDKDKKAHVAGISDLKEKHKRENDKLKEIKTKLKDVQDKLQRERQSGVEESSSTFDVAFQAMLEERERTQRENQQLVEDELEKKKLELQHQKADLQMRFSSNSLVKSNEEVLQHETELAQLRSEMSVMTTQLDALKREKEQMESHMRVLAEKHSRELEIQQLQNLQTFRAYREVFEEFKLELENRWRGLLDDAIQDAVFLNARNGDLMEDNAKLKLEVAQLKDDRSIKGTG